jgi:hypothetical protein
VEPTNNRAERVLRPAVIARKVSHCSKNESGAEAFAAFTSVARTTVKKGVATVTEVFHRLIKDGPRSAPSFLTPILGKRGDDLRIHVSAANQLRRA